MSLSAPSALTTRTRGRRYTGAQLARIAFPIGGIGAGTVSLGGRGNLQDFELLNRPGKGDNLDNSFFALRLEPEGGEAVCRVVEREHLPPFDHALGFRNFTGAGLPRFREAAFRGEYPFAEIDFEDEAVPAEVRLEAFNPFAPTDVAASSIPGLLLTYRVRNTSQRCMAVSLLGVMQNPILATRKPVGYLGPGVDDERFVAAPGEEESLNQTRSGGGLTGLWFTCPSAPPGSVFEGTAALTTPWTDTDLQSRLYRGPWWDNLQMLWNEFATTGRIEARLEPVYGEPLDEQRSRRRFESGAICLRATLGPGESVELPVMLHWHFPNARLWGGATAVPCRTYVGVQFRDAWDAAEHTLRELPRLRSSSEAWREALFSSTLPEPVLDAVATTVSTIRTQTVLRLEDGAIYAWEGCADREGSCCGNCTHVWNYEQALAFLFPELERTMRRIDFGANMRADGGMTFRCDAPVGAGNTTANTFHTCADGQMGNVMQAHRDWRLSGDDAFLRAIWPNVRRALEYAWQPGGWDPDADGIMEGCQHNTYDIEFYGPNPMIGTLYLGALKAAETMASHLGEADTAARYRKVREHGQARLEVELWNGEYFAQRVEVMQGLTLPRHLQDPAEPSLPKYQFGDGCLSDQLIGQWEAHVCGLGRVVEAGKARTALQAIFRHNFRPELRNVGSVQRVFGFQGEAGLILCSWPRGGRPPLPFVYSDEVWTGIEYQVAAHMIYEGLVDEGVTIVEALRARYDGVRRNPWDEIECGHHYARALASWSLVQAFSGAQYDGVAQSLSFAPKVEGPFRCVVMLGGGWGVLSRDEGGVRLEVRHGEVTLRRFGLAGHEVAFGSPRTIRAGEQVAA
jgi:uncharacterized protein (DUF608 family)